MAEALEYTFPSSSGYGSLYPSAADGRDYRPVMRGFANYWVMGPIYRVTAGLIPGSVWRTSFGTDRAGLIGHKLDPDKLEAKIPRNYSSLDNHLSMLEPLFHRGSSTWIFSTPTPSLADISLYNQLNWGIDIASGRGIEDLTAGGTLDTDTEGAIGVFNKDRYPGLHRWFYDFRGFMDSLPSTETVATTAEDVSFVLKELQNLTVEDDGAKMLLPTTNSSHKELDERNGLVPGTRLSVAPDDTGKDDPTFGTLLAMSPEEVIIRPGDIGGKSAPIDVNVHFPRAGFVFKPVERV